MIVRASHTLTFLTALGGGLLLAGGAFAQSAVPQETPAQARARAATSALNGGPAQTTLTPRPNAQPPLPPPVAQPVRPPMATQAPTAPRPAPPTRPTAPAPAPAPPQASYPARAVPPTPGQVTTARATTNGGTTTRSATTGGSTSGATNRTIPSQQSSAPQGPSIILEAGATAPPPIPLPLGYYVRGDRNCNQVWPGEGDLAWFTPTSFTIDFGGCEPGQFLQTGPNAWSEEQRCMTELGGDAGAYSVTYEAVGADTLLRRARLALDGRVEQDQWRFCKTEDVPREARFRP